MIAKLARHVLIAAQVFGKSSPLSSPDCAGFFAPRGSAVPESGELPEYLQGLAGKKVVDGLGEGLEALAACRLEEILVGGKNLARLEAAGLQIPRQLLAHGGEPGGIDGGRDRRRRLPGEFRLER